MYTTTNIPSHISRSVLALALVILVASPTAINSVTQAAPLAPTTFTFGSGDTGPTITKTVDGITITLSNGTCNGSPANIYADPDGIFIESYEGCSTSILSTDTFQISFDSLVTFVSYQIGYHHGGGGTFDLTSPRGSSTGNVLNPAGTYSFNGSLSVAAGEVVNLTTALLNDTSLSQIKSITVELAPTAVTITDFGGQAAWGRGPVLYWQTGDEMALSGFHIWRGSPAQAETRLTDELIGASGALTGNDYTWQDVAPLAWGQRLHYWLEAVEADGSSSFTGPVEVVGIGKLFLPSVGR